MPHITAKGYWVLTKRQKGVFFSQDHKTKVWVMTPASFRDRATRYRESWGILPFDAGPFTVIPSQWV
jgi:hypothetical protein